MQRESMQYDVVIVGAGLAGLSAAIRLKQLAAKSAHAVSVCVLDKYADIGAHLVGGAVVEAATLADLTSDCKNVGPPPVVPVTEGRFLFLNGSKAYQAPAWMPPAHMRKQGSCVVCLGDLVRWLGRQALRMGVVLRTGVVASDVLMRADGTVKGIADVNSGAVWRATYTLVCDDACPPLGKQLVDLFGNDLLHDVRVDAIGITEAWEIDSRMHQHGLVLHAVGWPLNSGAFLYHLERNRLVVDYVARLPSQSPDSLLYEEFKRCKNHPDILPFFAGARRLSHEVRPVADDPMPMLPMLIFPGGALAGAAESFSSAVHGRSSQTAMQSGRHLADAAFTALTEPRRQTVYALPIFNEETNHAT